MPNARENIRLSLMRYHLTFTWLINELERKQGIKTSSTEMSNILRGIRKGKKVDRLIAAASEILKEYGESYGNA